MTTGAKQRSKELLDHLEKRFMEDGLAEPVLRERTSAVDAMVLKAYEALAMGFPDGLALLAVGGYGRRSLFPYSDVDLVLLVRRPVQDTPGKEALSEFLRFLWDAGLRVSQSVRTIEECCALQEGNFELTVSLLDERFLAGDRVLYSQMRERWQRFLRAEQRDLERRLCKLSRSRHARFHDTIYRLEPDIKDAPGGIRDLQTVHWLRLLRESAAGTQEDPRPGEFLAAVRCFLHFRAGRDNNVLDFESQDAICTAPFSTWPDPAKWMRQFFTHSSAIWRNALYELESTESRDRPLLANFRDWRARLSNAEFTVSRDLVFLRHPHELERDPDLPLRLFRFVAMHGVPLARQTGQRLAAARMQGQSGAAAAGAAFWMELLSQPYTVLGLRAMASTGYLSFFLPEWERIEHLVVRDFYHQYTVDEHTLVALEALRSLQENRTAEMKRFVDLLEESHGNLGLLRFAILLHDLGKGSGRDHSTEASRLARDILAREGFNSQDSEVIVFLIEQHLALSAAMQSRDLHDPHTARDLAAMVKTVERLRLLTLLTFADISAVNPAAMTPWRMEQLWRVYRVTARELSRELTEDDDESPVSVYGELTPQLAAFLDGLPWRYLWTHDRKQVEEHCSLFEKSQQSGVALAIEKRSGVWRLSIVTPDRPFLFAAIAGALSSFGLNILKAEAFSNRQGAIVDSFIFSDPGGSLDLNPPELERLRQTLRRVASGELNTEDLLRYRPVKQPPSRLGAIEPSVGVDNSASSVATIFEVVALDRPGLLYHLASAISRAGCNIEVVLVDTEAHKAIDVFHLKKGGRKLTADESAAVRNALLAACSAKGAAA